MGVGRADITPPTGYYMMGWVRSDGVIQGQNTRLWARVIVLKQGDRKLALVSEDLNGIPGGMMKQAADADRDIGFSEQNVVISATHTHSGPSHFYAERNYNDLSSRVAGYDSALARFLVDGFERALIQAWESRVSRVSAMTSSARNSACGPSAGRR